MAEPWAVVASWTTPTPLFLLLNVVIGFIAIISVIASRKNDHPPPPPEHHQIHHQESPKRLLRAPSLFSRVTSFNFSDLNDSFSYSYGSSSAFDEPAHPPENSALFAPAPTFLSRMTSFKSLYLHRSAEPDTISPAMTDEQPPVSDLNYSSTHPYGSSSAFEDAAPHPENLPLDLHRSVESEINPSPATTNDEATPTPTPQPRASYLLSRIPSFNRLSANKSAVPETNPLQSEPTIARAPSLLSRMWSFDFSFNRSTETGSESAPEDAPAQHVTRSATELKNKKKVPRMIKESSSEKREKEKETASFGNEEVDAKADDFINKFKQQLRLQRLDSLLRFKNSAS